MSEKIDVLAVMDRMERAARNVFHSVLPADVAEARAAVAELIEADREYDAAFADELESRDWDANTVKLARRKAARERRTAALARVQP